MNKSSIPEFTAEISLGLNSIYIAKKLDDAFSGQVIQQIARGCFLRRYPCYEDIYGNVRFCYGYFCTDSGWEPGAGSPF